MMFSRSERMIKVYVALLGLLVLLGSYFLNPNFFHQLLEVCMSGDLNQVITYINSFGMWAMVCSFLLMVLVNIIGFPPSVIFSAATAVLFGLGPGIIMVWLAETVGVVLGFILLRFFFKDVASTIIVKHSSLKKIDELSGKEGFKIMLIARLLPYFPSGLLNALGAVSSMSFKAFFWAALIGKLPATAIETIIGHDAITIDENSYRLLITVILTLVIFGAFFLHERKKKKTGESK